MTVLATALDVIGVALAMFATAAVMIVCAMLLTKFVVLPLERILFGGKK